MYTEFKGKGYWSLILGGSSGLGLATAKKMAKHGSNICIVHRDSSKNKELIAKAFKEIESYGVQLVTFNINALDNNDRTSVVTDLKELFKGDDGIRLLVHSIAKGHLKALSGEQSIDQDDFMKTIYAMGVSLFDWVSDILKADLFKQDARVVSYTSEGNTKAWKGYAAVSAAKNTLEAITRSMALELAPYGIKANCIQPGAVDTPAIRMIPGSDTLIKNAIKRNPNKKLTLPEQVADVTYLLAKDEASWINGTIIPVDGGEHIC